MKKTTTIFLVCVAFCTFGLTKIKCMEANIEVWKDIEHIRGYQVSNLGRVRSIKRSTVYKDGRIGNYPGRVLKTSLNRDGYVLCYPTVDGAKYSPTVHRLVGIAFVHNPNPENLKEINHKDTNKQNNSASNLEWSNRGENMRHAHKNGLVKHKKGGDNPLARAVYQFSADGFLIGEYPSLQDAQKATGIGFRQISAVCLGHRKTVHGYKFSY